MDKGPPSKLEIRHRLPESFPPRAASVQTLDANGLFGTILRWFHPMDLCGFSDAMGKVGLGDGVEPARTGGFRALSWRTWKCGIEA